MKIQLWSIGKSHDEYVKSGVEDFTARISKYFPIEWKIIAPAKQNVNSLESDIKKTEGEKLLQLIQKDDFLVLLDERGKQINSIELANFIQTRANLSVRNLIFLIGGAYGVDNQIVARANFNWSISKLVFPHQLVRLILAEQLYRACTILRNEKYHHQ